MIPWKKKESKKMEIQIQKYYEERDFELLKNPKSDLIIVNII